MSFEELAGELIQIRKDSARRQSSEAVKKLTSGEMYVMDYLHRHQNTAYPKDLYRALNVSSARIAKMLNVLEEKDLIHRMPDQEDSRKTVVCLTDKGMEKTSRYTEDVSAYLTSILELAGETDAAEYVRLEKKLAELMKRYPFKEWKHMHDTGKAESSKEDTNGNTETAV